MKCLRRSLAALVVSVLLAAITAGAAGKSGAAETLFNGKDLSGWKRAGSTAAGDWQVGTAAIDPLEPTRLSVSSPGSDLVSCVKSPNLISQDTFGDCALELDFMLSKNSNSGVKMMGIYEIQLLDSYGKAKMSDSDCGAVYKEAAPLKNACKKPGEWQKLVIDFRAPKFDETGKKTANAKFVKVTLNGQVIQENVEVEHGTNVSRNAKERPLGPILLQGDHGPVAFRNMKITRVE